MSHLVTTLIEIQLATIMFRFDCFDSYKFIIITAIFDSKLNIIVLILSSNFQIASQVLYSFSKLILNFLISTTRFYLIAVNNSDDHWAHISQIPTPRPSRYM